jgi:hypothetical protein
LRPQQTYLDPCLFALVLNALDLCLEALDLVLDELQTAVHAHEGLGLFLFEEDGADLLVDGGIVGEQVELLLDIRVLLLLRLEALACLDGCGKLYMGCEGRAVFAAKRGTYLLAGPGSPRTAPAASSACRPCRSRWRGRKWQQRALGCGLELEPVGGGNLKRASMAGLDSGLGRGRLV